MNQLKPFFVDANTSLPSPIGLGFRTVHYKQVIEERPAVGWFEVISENFIQLGGRPRYFLEQLRQHYQVACHGIGLTIGSTDPLNQNYLKKLKALIDLCEPFLVTDHLCWTSHGGHNSHDLLPLPYTEESLSHIASRVDAVQTYLGRQILLENPSAYVAFAHSTIGEAEFLAELARRTGCGILLDVNNLFVNQCNLGLDPIAYLNTLPKHAVGQFHLSGHTTGPHVRIDTHDHPIDDKVWNLFQLAANRWPAAPALIEWDDHIPALADLLQVATKAEQLHNMAQTLSTVAIQSLIAQASEIANVPMPLMGQDSVDEGEVSRHAASLEGKSLKDTHERFLAAITTAASNKEEAAESLRAILHPKTPVDPEVGFGVYHNAYFSRIRDVLRELFEGFAFLVEEEDFDILIADFLKRYPPSTASINEIGAKLSEYLEQDDILADFGVDHRLVADIVRLEWLQLQVFDALDAPVLLTESLATITPEQWPNLRFNLHPAMQFFTARCNAQAILTKLLAKELPERPVESTHHYLIARRLCEVEVVELNNQEMAALHAIAGGKSFFEVAECFMTEEGAADDEELRLQLAVGFLIKLCRYEALSNWYEEDVQISDGIIDANHSLVLADLGE